MPTENKYNESNVWLCRMVIIITIATVVLTISSGLHDFLGKGDRILFVEIVSDDDEEEISEIAVIENALKYGGQISIDVETIRKIDANFDSKYTNTDSSGMFLIRPALLNYIGAQGWHLVQSSVGDYIFAKSYYHFNFS